MTTSGHETWSKKINLKSDKLPEIVIHLKTQEHDSLEIKKNEKQEDISEAQDLF